MHIWDLQGAHIWGHVQHCQVRRNLYLYISNLCLYMSTKALRATSGRRTPRRAADGRTGGHPGGQRTGGGAILRMGIHAYAMREGRTRREPQRGGREDVSTHPLLSMSERRDGRGKVRLSGHMIHSIMTGRRDGEWAYRGMGKDEG
jgi:hypothetical protein